MEVFGKTGVEFHEGGVSDHSPEIISVGKFQSFGQKPFKFFGYWAENERFLSWVEEGWNIKVVGVPMFKLYAKLKAVKKKFLELRRVVWRYQAKSDSSYSLVGSS
jgi:hypothetical protein